MFDNPKATGNFWFTPGSNFADETIGQFGNISRNKFYGPSSINTDAAFYQNLHWGEAGPATCNCDWNPHEYLLASVVGI